MYLAVDVNRWFHFLHWQACRRSLTHRTPSRPRGRLRVKALKGQVHEMDIFLRSEHFNQYTSCEFADGVQGLSKSFFHCPYTYNHYFYLLLWNSWNAYWNPPHNSLLCDWSMFSSVDSTLAAGKCARIICHRRLLAWFYGITGSFLCTFSVSKSLL